MSKVLQKKIDRLIVKTLSEKYFCDEIVNEPVYCYSECSRQRLKEASAIGFDSSVETLNKKEKSLFSFLKKRKPEIVVIVYVSQVETNRSSQLFRRSETEKARQIYTVEDIFVVQVVTHAFGQTVQDIRCVYRYSWPLLDFCLDADN